MRGLFVTGTDTGVGKTVLSAVLLASMAAGGERVRAYKPAVTGLEQPEEERQSGGREVWPADHELLAQLTGMTPEEVSPLRFGPAMSPHLAARLAGVEVEPQALVDAAVRAAGGDTLVVEGVGGLLVPLCTGYTIRDLAVALGLPLLIAARPGLGTINHTLLTLQAARAARLDVRAVVMTPWPQQPTVLERSNRETIERIGELEVAVLSPVAEPSPGALAQAGAALSWQRWLGE
jgi:dethiobiotin synthetase